MSLSCQDVVIVIFIVIHQSVFSHLMEDLDDDRWKIRWRFLGGTCRAFFFFNLQSNNDLQDLNIFWTVYRLTQHDIFSISFI